MKKGEFSESRESIGLEQAEELSGGLLESAQTGIYIVQDGKFVYVNSEFEKSSGYTRKELIGRHPLELVHPDDRERVREEAIARLKREKTTSFEYRVVRKDGELRWIMEKLSPFQYRGRPATMGNYMDITERKRKEEEVEKERRFSQNVLATILDPLLVLNKDLTIKSANRSFYKLFQTKPAKIIGCKIADVLGDEDGKLSAELTRLFGTKATLKNFVMHHRSEKLGERILHITAKGMHLAEEEEEEEEVIVIHDDTERQQAEDALRAAERNFRKSVDGSPLGVRIVSEEGETYYANRAILNIYGYSSLDELDTPAIQRYTPESYAEHQKRKEQRRLGKPVPSSYEISIVRKDGEVRHITVFRKEVIWNGKTQFQVLYLDTTEHKRTEWECRQKAQALLQVMETTIHGLFTAIEMRDPYTASHQRRVTSLATAIAAKMGLQEEVIQGIRMAGTIHDIGKINVPAEILSRPGQLTETEFNMIKTHPQAGYDILKTIEFPWPIARIVLHHHERMDGSGYPSGLSGEDILLEARVLAVADVVEAMSSHRPYRPSLGIDKALEELSRNKGILYDSMVVDACLRLFARKEFKFE